MPSPIRTAVQLLRDLNLCRRNGDRYQLGLVELTLDEKGKAVTEKPNAWEAHVEECKRDGGVLQTPNGLPVGCIRHDGVMLECEHGDHPDYIFPVTAKFIGEPEMLEGFAMEGDEIHALIYHDDCAALTLHECSYFMWSLIDGRMLCGPGWSGSNYRLAEEDCLKIRERAKSKGP